MKFDVNASTRRLDDIASFPVIFQDIEHAYHGDSDLKVCVSNQTVLAWLKNMASRFPHGTFLGETIDARSALAQQWDIDIPVTVMNEDILQTGLLTSDLRPQPGISFEDILLAHCYTPSLIAKKKHNFPCCAALKTTNHQTGRRLTNASI